MAAFGSSVDISRANCDVRQGKVVTWVAPAFNVLTFGCAIVSMRADDNGLVACHEGRDPGPRFRLCIWPWIPACAGTNGAASTQPNLIACEFFAASGFPPGDFRFTVVFFAPDLDLVALLAASAD
ncbi:MAG: hypothetical protein K2Y27_35005 [Xanthobacteraceae bacterium]|nr:hypothetical protein [Xanthobacteraceae bacterium]